MEMFLTNAFLIVCYVAITFVSVWCAAAVTFLAMDKLVWAKREQNQISAPIKKNHLKVLKGGRDDVSVHDDNNDKPIR